MISSKMTVNGYDLSWILEKHVHGIEDITFDWTKCLMGTGLDNRLTYPVHITASALIVNASHNQMLLLYHTSLCKYLQPGGHLESGETPLDAAIREVEEECHISRSSIIKMQEHPVDIDLHYIPENISKKELEHWHFDFCYFMEIAPESSKDLCLGNTWISLEEVTSSRLKRLAKIIKNNQISLKMGGL